MLSSLDMWGGCGTLICSKKCKLEYLGGVIRKFPPILPHLKILRYECKYKCKMPKLEEVQFEYYGRLYPTRIFVNCTMYTDTLFKRSKNTSGEQRRAKDISYSCYGITKNKFLREKFVYHYDDEVD
jgi:hypothetical protein